jgi:type VI secretion system protein ImpK
MPTVAPPTLRASPAPPAPQRRGTLALAFQEPLTAGARLRANRQVAADADAFRAQIKHLIARADQEARQAGYDPADVKLAVYGYVAFLDESVLNSGLPMFAAWARQPLQEELFGDHRGGELFFMHLDELLARPDSDDLSDLLELFQLCMLLGFRGRYSAVEDGGLRTRVQATQQKIERIRGRTGPLSPAAPLPLDEALPESRDPWLRRLLLLVGTLLVITVVLYLVYRVSLGGQLADLRELAAGLLQ